MLNICNSLQIARLLTSFRLLHPAKYLKNLIYAKIRKFHNFTQNIGQVYLRSKEKKNNDLNQYYPFHNQAKLIFLF
jgi:hypothetical protein